MPIKFPTWKLRSSPTPSDKLAICDTCQQAEWVPHSGDGLTICRGLHPDGKTRRMREATPDEYEKGKAALTRVIGGENR